jgi:hypothetical protein
MDIVRTIEQALDWQDAEKPENESRSVYIRLAWGEVRAVDVSFTDEDDATMTIVTTSSDTIDQRIIAPTSSALAVRRHTRIF